MHLVTSIQKIETCNLHGKHSLVPAFSILNYNRQILVVLKDRMIYSSRFKSKEKFTLLSSW